MLIPLAAATQSTGRYPRGVRIIPWIVRQARRLNKSLASNACSVFLVPVLAQASEEAPQAAAEGPWPFIDWAIVVVLVGAVLFVICRSSRRN